MNQQELMEAVKEAVRHDGFTVSDNYLKGCDYPFGGGYMISCEGTQFGSLRHQGGGVIFNAEWAKCYITDAEEIPILVNRVEMAWGLLQNEWADEGEDEESMMPDVPNYGSFEGNEALDDEPEWDRKYDKGGASL